MLRKKKELVRKLDREIEQTLEDMRKEGVNDTDRLIMSDTLENLARLKTAEIPASFEDHIKNCLNEMEVARINGDIDTYTRLAQSLDSITKAQSNVTPKDGGIGKTIFDGVVTIVGTLIIANFDRMHVIPRNVMDWFKFLSRK